MGANQTKSFSLARGEAIERMDAAKLLFQDAKNAVDALEIAWKADPKCDISTIKELSKNVVVVVMKANNMIFDNIDKHPGAANLAHLTLSCARFIYVYDMKIHHNKDGHIDSDSQDLIQDGLLLDEKHRVACEALFGADNEVTFYKRLVSTASKIGIRRGALGISSAVAVVALSVAIVVLPAVTLQLMS